MINDLTALYTATLDNSVVVFDTNLAGFIAKLAKIEPGIRNYAHYSRQFKKSDSMDYVNAEGKTYRLQKTLAG